MDFSRFLRRKPKELTVALDPLTAFIDAWEQVKVVLEFPDERMLLRGIKSTCVPTQLQQMVDTVVDEFNPVDDQHTQPVLEYLLNHDVLGQLERLSEPDRPTGVRAEVLVAFNLLVSLLDERFLVHNVVHRPLRRLLRSCVGDEPEEQHDGEPRVVGAAGASARTNTSDYEKDLLELMCMLCKRIRSYPSLLLIFFNDKTLYAAAPKAPVTLSTQTEDSDLFSSFAPPPGSPTPSSSASALQSSDRGDAKKEQEFLLFTYLLRFVHRESPIGEFARAGILFLIDVAFSPGDDPMAADPLADVKLLLAEYMLDGDFPEVLGAGLGAVYSLLPNKLIIMPEGATDTTEVGGAMILGGFVEPDSDSAALNALGDLSTSPQFRALLDLFLKFLEFLSDVVRRPSASSSSPAEDSPSELSPQMIVGSAMSRAILQAVRSTFLEHVLYPSILECSDQDGSAIAVLAYIEAMLSALDPRSSLTQMLLSFLMGEDEANVSSNWLGLSGNFPAPLDTASKKAAKGHRRKSTAMIVLENFRPAPSSQYTSQDRFSLKDLIVDNAASHDPATSVAALRLLNTVLVRCPSVALRDLLSVLPDPRPAPAPFKLPTLSFSPNAELESFSLLTPASPVEGDDDVFVYPTQSEREAAATGSPPPPVSFESLAVPDWMAEKEEQKPAALVAPEKELYLALVAEMNAASSTATPESAGRPSNYTSYITDAQARLESDRSLSSFQLSLLTASADNDCASSTSILRRFRLNPHDTLLRLLLDSLRGFFVRAPQENLALTGVLASLALCGDLSLEGWLIFPEEDKEDPWAARDRQESGSGGSDEDETMTGKVRPPLAARIQRAVDDPFAESADSLPILYVLFRNLARKLERYRLLVPEFDHYLAERRQGLFFEETMSDILMDVSETATPFKPSISRSGSSTFSTPTRPQLAAPPASPSRLSFLSPIAAISTPQSKAPPVVKSLWPSFLSPRTNRTSTPAASSTPPVEIDPFKLPYTPRSTQKWDGSRQPGPLQTPHAAHYQATEVQVERLVAESPRKGMWSPASAGQDCRLGLDYVAEEEDQNFEIGSDDDEVEEQNRGGKRIPVEEQHSTRQVSLSTVLDNVVILEECIKELVAITVVRLSKETLRS